MNVALVVLDALRKDAISPYDDAIEHTPNIAAFADDATVYDNAVAQAPWSLPSQASILTGRYPWQHGAGQCQPYLEPAESLLQEALRAAGYRTGAIHENTWLVPATGAMDGFDRFSTPADETRHLARAWRELHYRSPGPALAKRVVLALSERHRRSRERRRTDSTRFLERTRHFLAAHGDEDFFLYLNPLNVHYPYAPPAAYADGHGVETTCAELLARPLEYGGRSFPTEEDRIRRLYAAEVDYLDDVFGRLVDLFEAEGVAEETLFVVLADHGELLGEAGLLGHHFSVRPELTEVPLLIRDPAGSGGRESAVTELREVYYEILHAADVPATDDDRFLDGRGAGLYETPRIYGERLPDTRAALTVPQFYHVGRGDREKSVPLGRAIQSGDHDVVRERLEASRRRPDARAISDPR